MHRLGAVAHKSSTCLCTDSREVVLPSAGSQQRIGTGAGPCWSGQCATCECPRHAGPITRPPVVGPTSGAAGSRRPQAGARSRVSLRPAGTEMIKVLANRNRYPLQIAAEFYAFISCSGHSCVGCGRTSISVRCEPTANRRLLKLNLARLMRQAGKRCYRRRPRRR